MTIETAAARLRAREVSAVELAQDSLRRIREEQPRLNAFITVTEELALERARRADEELARGLAIAEGTLEIAELVIGDREIAQVIGAARLLLDQPPANL